MFSFLSLSCVYVKEKKRSLRNKTSELNETLDQKVVSWLSFIWT